MQQFFLARQPILDRNESLCAFELLFRSAINALGADWRTTLMPLTPPRR